MIAHLLWIIAQIIAAWWLTDLASGLYHWLTDKGWNVPHQVRLFQFHHDYPSTMTHDWQPLVAGLPMLAIGLWIGSLFVATFGAGLCVAQVPHYYTHHPAPPIVRWLQRWRIFCRPRDHAVHHRDHSKNFALVNGWTNPLLNRLLW